VRVRAATQAARSADAVDADAYAVGRHVVFAQGRYEPHTERGKRLLAHELAHVLQQGNRSRADRTPRHRTRAKSRPSGRAAAPWTTHRGAAESKPRAAPAGEGSRGGAGTPASAPDTSRWPFGNLIPADVRAAYIDDRAVSVAVQLILGTAYITLDDGREIELPHTEFPEASYNLVAILPGAPTRLERRLRPAELRWGPLWFSSLCRFRATAGVLRLAHMGKQQHDERASR
jgi:Domain of unknown function (DUF4157)